MPPTSRPAPTISALLALLAAVAVLDRTISGVLLVGANMCECKWLGTSYMVTRLWNVVDDGWTDLKVINEFDKGFAPVVADLPGFQVYTSAVTGNDSTVFFMNIFESQETAKAAQEGAKRFVEEGALNGAITPNQFTETYLSFHFTAGNCVRESIEGKYLSTRLWRLTENSNFTIAGVSLEFEAYYKPIIQREPGFLEYGGATVTDTDYIFFFNVFETAQGAEAANVGAEQFMREGNLMGSIERVAFTAGTVEFDYQCAIPKKAAAPHLVAGGTLMLLFACLHGALQSL